MVTGLPLTVMSIVFGVAFDLGLEENLRHGGLPGAGHPGAEPDRARSVRADARSARGGVLTSLLVLPLYIPVLIFAGGGGCSGDQRQLFRVSPLLGAFLAVRDLTDAWLVGIALRISRGVVDELIEFLRPRSDD